jgi:hypothetical protein
VTFGAVGGGVFALFAGVSVVLAVAAVWLLLTDPVSVATTVSEGSVPALVRELAGLVLAAVKGILRFL